MTRLILASASPARLSLLRAAGVHPEVVISGVDESGVTGPASYVAGELAQRKARAVANRLGEAAADALVLGCDSVLEFEGETLGKPLGSDDARQRWMKMRGKSGVLHSGHHMLHGSREIGAVSSTVVRFANVDDSEIDAYVATGEPLRVAGAFTVDGLGGWFIDSVEGDPGTVIGLSLPLLRRLLADLGLSVTDLWGSTGDTGTRHDPSGAEER